MDTRHSVSVIGLGYVGLPLALAFAKAGLRVNGLDIDPKKIERLAAGQSYLSHISPESVAGAVRAGSLVPTGDFAAVGDTSAAVICVPTPLDRYREPDLSFVMATGEMVAKAMKPGTLVVLESTTYPGTTEGELRRVLEAGSGMEAGRDFHLAFSPEREDPGNPASHVSAVPKIVGGLTPTCRERAVALYSHVARRVVPVSSCRVAEAAKLLENIFRGVNIALVNELKVVYGAMGIDIWEVIEAAKTKPFGFMPFYPGPGLGGHCIPIDPFYLTWKAREFGQHTRFIELAGEINTAMPRYVVERLVQALNARGKPVKGSRILLLGLAYKADVGDIRESPTFILMDLLKELGADVQYHDPFVPEIPTTREHAAYAGIRSVPLDEPTVRAAAAVVIATAHRQVDYRALAEWAECIVDTRNAMAAAGVADGRVIRA